MTHEHQIRGMLCRHAATKQRPIELVIHEHSGMWVFSCGKGDHPEIDAFVGLCLECSMNKMEEFSDLRHLERGQWAEPETTIGNGWAIHTMPPEEEPGQ